MARSFTAPARLLRPSGAHSRVDGGLRTTPSQPVGQYRPGPVSGKLNRAHATRWKKIAARKCRRDMEEDGTKGKDQEVTVSSEDSRLVACVRRVDGSFRVPRHFIRRLWESMGHAVTLQPLDQAA